MFFSPSIVSALAGSNQRTRKYRDFVVAKAIDSFTQNQISPRLLHKLGEGSNLPRLARKKEASLEIIGRERRDTGNRDFISPAILRRTNSPTGEQQLYFGGTDGSESSVAADISTIIGRG